MSRTVQTTLDDVLSMVACMWNYGHTNGVAQEFFWTLAGGVVTDEEIEAFVQAEFLTDKQRAKGYDDEDADAARQVITAWRSRHTK